ncbi:hypothetical protein AGDE_12593 [Angomonas deanei]|uniref:Uncharacterized protein n=1 Tax=Angomonas deanei TaxID=59799 RepID=A0A7G2CDV8_9TRYP|nr:hypothetical protein AGDE_12593 [Angomonas deanei]CAD2217044.1 hypothetical protein, conserved [Angomonas deanei]|eukprot:EPY24140.1 hypothetical protein AGDE_12593 [Angomonas deanei]
MEVAGDVERAVNYYIIAEESARAAYLLSRQSSANADAATVLSRTCPQRSAQEAATQEPPHNTTVDVQGASKVAQEIAQERTTKALERHRNSRLYAAVQIANFNCDEAVRLLHYTGDVCLAHLVVHTAPMREQSSIDTVYMMSMLQSARQHKWDTALLCAGRQSNPYHSFATLVAYFQYTQSKQFKSSLPPSQSMTSVTPGNFGNISEKLRGFYEKVVQEIARLQLPLDAGSIQQRHANDGLASQNQLAAMVIQSDPQIGPTTSSNILQSFSGYIESLLGAALQDIDGPNSVFYLKQAFSITGYVAFPLVSSSQGVAGMAPEHRKFLALAYIIASLMCVKVYRFPKMLNYIFTKARETAAGDGNMEQFLTRVQGALGKYNPASIEVDCTPLGSTVPSLSGEGKQVISIFSNEAVCGPLHLLEDGTSFVSREEALAWTLVCHFSPLATGARLTVL